MSSSTHILIGLVAGIALGAGLGSGAGALIGVAEVAGELWLDALRMTVTPLVFSLLVTSIASAASMAATRGLAGKALAIFAALLLGSGLFSAMLTPALLTLWPLPANAADALRVAIGQSQPPPAVPPLSEWFSSLIPENIFKAAADGAMLQIVLFALAFGFAITRTAEEVRLPLVRFFQGVADTMMILVGWVLWIAPAGVFALALVVGAKTGLAATGALLHYVLIVCTVCVAIILSVYPLTRIVGGVPLLRYARAAAPAQVVAASTQSSLASLPAMLQGAQEALGIPNRVAGLVLPMAVSLFRITSPGANMAIAIYIAHLSGVHLGPLQLVAGAVVALSTSLGVAGIASQVSFFAGAAPVCAAMGVPVEALALFIAVETIPDIFRTIGNVSADVGVTAIIAKSESAH